MSNYFVAHQSIWLYVFQIYPVSFQPNDHYTNCNCMLNLEYLIAKSQAQADEQCMYVCMGVCHFQSCYWMDMFVCSIHKIEDSLLTTDMFFNHFHQHQQLLADPLETQWPLDLKILTFSVLVSHCFHTSYMLQHPVQITFHEDENFKKTKNFSKSQFKDLFTRLHTH